MVSQRFDDWFEPAITAYNIIYCILHIHTYIIVHTYIYLFFIIKSGGIPIRQMHIRLTSSKRQK